MSSNDDASISAEDVDTPSRASPMATGSKQLAEGVSLETLRLLYLGDLGAITRPPEQSKCPVVKLNPLNKKRILVTGVSSEEEIPRYCF
jgi:hypothetical protein